MLYPLSPLIPCAGVDLGSRKASGLILTAHSKGWHTTCELGDKTNLGMGTSPVQLIPQDTNIALTEKTLLAFAVKLMEHHVPPENVCAVATAALRALQESYGAFHPILQRLQHAFAPYSFTVISGREEATLVGETIINDPGFRAARHRLGEKITAACIGGGSTEILHITKTPDGDVIENPTEIPYGIHWLEAAPQHPKEFPSILQDYWQHSATETLCVIGGIWRKIGESLCGSAPALIEDNAEAKIGSHQTPAAQTLASIARHTGAQRVFFPQRSMIYGIAQRAYEQTQATKLTRLTA